MLEAEIPVFSGRVLEILQATMADKGLEYVKIFVNCALNS
jgi:hypothetical protein